MSHAVFKSVCSYNTEGGLGGLVFVTIPFLPRIELHFQTAVINDGDAPGRDKGNVSRLKTLETNLLF